MHDLQEAPNAFNFSAWVTLAKENPAAFDELRRRHIEDAIATSCSRGDIDPRKLRGLQWQLDTRMMKDRTPLKSCLWLSGMMWDSFHEMNEALNLLIEERQHPRVRTVSVQHPSHTQFVSAQIVPFNKQTPEICSK